MGSLDLMDTNRWRPYQVGEAAMDAGDWRSQLQADSRQRIVNKIMDTLKRHLPFSGQDGLQELSKIAVRFEEKIYTAATSQSDYLQKISLKMLTMETKSQNSVGNPFQSNSAGNSNGPPDPVLLGSLDLMDTNKWGPSQVGEAAMDAGDWRSQLPADSRQGIVNKIMDTLKRHLPFSGQDGLQELSKIAVRFEEKIYTAATSQSDYLRKISLKMLTMETKSQNSVGNPFQSNSAGNSNGPPDPVLLGSLDLMDTNKWGPSQVGEAAMDAGDWRSQLPADSRQGIVNKIMDTLKRHLPFSGQDGLQELSKIAVRFEEKIYTAATSQSDYLRKISLKMLTMETKSQNSVGNPFQSNSAGNSNGPPDPGSFGMQPQVPNQGMQPQVPSQASLDSSAQTGYVNGGDWLEEVYQKIKVMKERYSPELCEMYQKIATKLQQHDSLPQQPKSEQLEKLKLFKTMLERLISVLQVPKSNISPGLKDKLGLYEKQIVNFINANRPRKQGPPLQQGQLPPPHMYSGLHHCREAGELQQNEEIATTSAK